jgi:hypothetical protein
MTLWLNPKLLTRNNSFDAADNRLAGVFGRLKPLQTEAIVA